MSSVKITPIKRNWKEPRKEYTEDSSLWKIEVMVLPSKSLYEIEFRTELTVRQVIKALVHYLNLKERSWRLLRYARYGRGREISPDDKFQPLWLLSGPQRFYLVAVAAWP